MENLFNIKQVAFILKVHPLTVRRYIREKKLPAVKAGGAVRIKEGDLQGFTRAFSPTPSERSGSKSFNKPTPHNNPFTIDDPFLRLEGRGASVNVTSR